MYTYIVLKGTGKIKFMIPVDQRAEQKCIERNRKNKLRISAAAAAAAARTERPNYVKT